MTDDRISLPLEPPRKTQRQLTLMAALAGLGSLLPGDVIHYETNKTAPTEITMECKDAAALKRLRKLEKSRAKR